MVSENLSQNDKPFYYLVKQKESCRLAIIFTRWHIFHPLHEVVYCYDDITVPPCGRRVACSVINPPLGEGTNCDDEKHGSRVFPHFSIEDMIQVALLDRFNTIFD
jgi:hypothetical protein